jgi:hypothetical protein
MNRLTYVFDNFKIEESKYTLVIYSLKSEVTHFIESGCQSNHIFIDIIIAGELGLADKSTKAYRIYSLSKDLIDSPDEDKSDELINLIQSLDTDDPESFIFND